MPDSYSGPLRDEPLAIELHNTIYASGGRVFDGLTAEAEAFLNALTERFPSPLPAGPWPSAGELIALRASVRTVLHAAIDGGGQEPAALSVINDAAARAPVSLRADRQRDGTVHSVADHAGATRAQIVLAAFASNAIVLITGPQRDRLRACGAPGCVLVYTRADPRRQWCCNACGNRARQARHYARSRP